MEERYYYIRDGANRPIITICLLKEFGTISRGIAICCDKDSPCKKVGRNIAKERAMFSLKSKTSGCFIEREKINSTVPAFSHVPITGSKATYKPTLTPREKKLFIARP